MAILASTLLRAEPGDVESSHDYPGFPRLPGFVISDYDEDSPAEFDFPVARPLPVDAAHVESVRVRGHRFVIRYELGANARVSSLYQTQKYYEKLASDAGFKIEKSGAVGDVTETFHRTTASHDIWVYLEPEMSSNILTVVESVGGVPPTPPSPVAAATTGSNPASAGPGDSSASAPVPPPITDPEGNLLYDELSTTGRTVVPFVFQPGKDDLDTSSQALIDRVVAMMKLHPSLSLRIEGHTDNTGNPEDDLRLSAQRALAVQAKLVAAKVDKRRLDAVGVGGLQPLADNTTAQGREKNRRIELVMWKKYPAFHTPAPNGNSYYPEASASVKPAIQ